MSWQQIKDIIDLAWNHPVPIICCSVGSLLVFVLVIISKTSIGKKALNGLRNLISELKSQITDLLSKFKGFKEEINQTLVEQNKMLENALNEKQAEIDRLVALVEKVAINTHNVKTIQALEEYKKEVTKNGGEEN